MKYNFNSGFGIGVILALAIMITGFFYIQSVISKSENVSQLNLQELEYQTLDGEEVHLEDFANKNILINFWATWCKPCIEEFPLLSETNESVKDDFVFLMVSYESIDKIKAFAKDKPYSFIFLKSNNFIMEGITSVPQSFVLNKQLETMYHHPNIFEGTSIALAKSLLEWIEK